MFFNIRSIRKCNTVKGKILKNRNHLVIKFWKKKLWKYFRFFEIWWRHFYSGRGKAGNRWCCDSQIQITNGVWDLLCSSLSFLICCSCSFNRAKAAFYNFPTVNSTFFPWLIIMDHDMATVPKHGNTPYPWMCNLSSFYLSSLFVLHCSNIPYVKPSIKNHNLGWKIINEKTRIIGQLYLVQRQDRSAWCRKTSQKW